MNKIVIDREMLAKLKELREKTEFCDETGKTLGYFQPVPARDQDLYKDVEVPPITEEEQQEMEKYIREGGKCFTTKEVLAHLKSLEKA